MSEVELGIDGPGAPPRKNGELVFEAPWESRLFGLTLALVRAGRFPWEEFRRRLIEEIADGEGDPGAYWSHWRAALERVLATTQLCPSDELARRVESLAARPHGHDH